MKILIHSDSSIQDSLMRVFKHSRLSKYSLLVDYVSKTKGIYGNGIVKIYIKATIHKFKIKCRHVFQHIHVGNLIKIMNIDREREKKNTSNNNYLVGILDFKKEGTTGKTRKSRLTQAIVKKRATRKLIVFTKSCQVRALLSIKCFLSILVI